MNNSGKDETLFSEAVNKYHGRCNLLYVFVAAYCVFVMSINILSLKDLIDCLYFDDVSWQFVSNGQSNKYNG